MIKFLLVSWTLSIFAFIMSISANDSIEIAYNKNWPPFSYQETQTEQVKGILVTLVEQILTEHMDMKVINNAQPWPRVQRSVQQGAVDAFITVATKERLEYSIPSKEIVYSIRMQGVARKDSKAIDKLETMQDFSHFRHLRVCEINGNGWGYRFWKKHKVEFEALSTTDKCLQQVSLNRADVTILPLAVANAYLMEAQKQSELAITKRIFGQMDFVLMVSKKASFAQSFLSKFDATIVELTKQGTYDKLVTQAMMSEMKTKD